MENSLEERWMNMRTLQLSIVAVMVAMVSVGAMGQVLVQWETSLGGNGHYYEAVNESLTWDAAKLAAEAQGGYLATVTSGGENEFIFSLIGDKPEFWYLTGDAHGPWLGGYVTAQDDWAWVTGETFDYTSWAPGEPNYAYETSLNYMGKNNTPASTWNNSRATDTNLQGYIVEYNVPEPGTLSLLLLGGFALLRRSRR